MAQALDIATTAPAYTTFRCTRNGDAPLEAKDRGGVFTSRGGATVRDPRGETLRGSTPDRNCDMRRVGPTNTAAAETARRPRHSIRRRCRRAGSFPAECFQRAGP